MATVKDRVLKKTQALKRTISASNKHGKYPILSSGWGKGGSWDKDFNKGWNKDGH